MTQDSATCVAPKPPVVAIPKVRYRPNYVNAASAPLPVNTVSAKAQGSGALAANALVQALSAPDAEVELCAWVLGAPATALPLAQHLMDTLADTDFAAPLYRQIWTLARGQIMRGEPVAASVLLDEANRLEVNVGGAEHLAQLAADPLAPLADAERLAQNARLLIDYTQRRRLDAALRQRIEDLRTNTPLKDILARADQDLQATAYCLEAAERTGPEHISAPMEAVIETIFDKERLAEGVMPTGIPELDDALDGGGLRDESLVLLAGRPSMGKTALVMNIARNVSLNVAQRRHILAFSGEMSSEQLSWRALANETGMTTSYLRAADERDPYLTEALAEVMPRFAPYESQDGRDNGGSTLWIDSSSGMTPAYVLSTARRFAQEHRTETEGILIIIDYLQLMAFYGNMGSKDADANRSVGAFSTQLKLLARSLKCPVIALSQLNRSLEQRANKRPILSDLRESGSLEQDADLILFAYRDAVYNENADPTLAEIIIGKQRAGALATVPLGFEGPLTRFHSLRGASYQARPAAQPAGHTMPRTDPAFDDVDEDEI